MQTATETTYEVRATGTAWQGFKAITELTFSHLPSMSDIEAAWPDVERATIRATVTKVERTTCTHSARVRLASREAVRSNV